MKTVHSAITTPIDSPKRPVNKVRPVLQRSLLVLVLVLVGHLAQAQMYILTTSPSNNFQKLNFGTTPTLTNLATWPRTTPSPTGAPRLCGVGKYLYAGQGNGTNLITRYNILTDTWTSQYATTGGISAQAGAPMVTDGLDLYQRLATNALTAAGVAIFDTTANSWTSVATLASVNQIFSGVGVVFVLQSGSLKQYTKGAASLTTLSALPSDVANNSSACADATNVYIIGDVVHVYNLAGNTWSTRPDSPVNFPNGFVSDGTYLYGKNGTDVYRYTISNLSGTWTNTGLSAFGSGTSPTASLPGSAYVAAAPVCAAPVISASVTQATCTGSTANNNGTISLTAFNANAKKVDYTIGSTYTGAGFASATTLPASAPYTVTSTLPNPTVNQPYTIRVFCDATTYTDKTVLLTPTKCQTADLSVAVSPATQTGNAGEFLTYTVTLTNAGPNTATNVGVSVPMPDPTATLLSATAATGSYSSTTKKWTVPSLAVGSTTLTFTVKVN